ncbi:MAG: prenyltransferase/squalene oxidase repeat-containing protein [Aquihabitans sp.]
MNRTDRRRRWMAPKFAAAVVAALAVGAGVAPAVSAAPVQAPPATCSTALSGDGGLAPALTWLRCELELNDNGFPGFSPGSVDGGSTLDAVMALSLSGQANDPITVAALARVEAEAGGYFSNEGWGDGTERYAGPMAKALLAAQLQGADPHDFGGYDLESELLGLIETTGPDAGRFSDVSEFGNWSNGFGQALGVLALSHSGDGIPTAAIDFLLDQQCPDGGFRGSYDTSGGCTDSADADTDYTAFAFQALLASPQTASVEAGIVSARSWLLNKQDASGSFAGTGLTAEPNANTTGIAAQALRADGQTAAADAAAAWLTTVQLTTANADGTPGAAEFGAIAYISAALDAAITDGIPELGRDQWRRSIGQASLGFAAGPYGAAPGVPPTTTTSTTTTTTTTTTTAVSTTTTETAPSTVPATTPSTGTTIGARDQLSAGNDSNSSGQNPGGGQLPATGADVDGLVVTGLMLLLAGAVLIVSTRRRLARSM